MNDTTILNLCGPVTFDVVFRTPDQNAVKSGYVACNCPACGDLGSALEGKSVHSRGHAAVQMSARLGGHIVVTCGWCGHRFHEDGSAVS